MTTTTSRRPLLVLALVTVVVVALLVVGALHRPGGAGGWVDRLRPGPAPAALRVGDLQPRSGSCGAGSGGADRLQVTGSCVADVPSAGGPLTLGGVTRQALLQVSGSPVHLVVTTSGRSVARDVAPGDQPLRLTYGTDGGGLALACVSCVVVLGPPR